MKKPYLLKIINDEILFDDKIKICTERRRDSEGDSNIFIKIIKDDVVMQSLNFSTKVYGCYYEQLAISTARCLEEIAIEPCNLPKDKKNG